MKKSVSNEMDKIKDYVRLARRAKRQLFYVTGVKMYNKALELISEYEWAPISEKPEISEFKLSWKKFAIKLERFFTVYSLRGLMFFDLYLDEYDLEWEEYIEEEEECIKGRDFIACEKGVVGEYMDVLDAKILDEIENLCDKQNGDWVTYNDMLKLDAETVPNQIKRNIV